MKASFFLIIFLLPFKLFASQIVELRDLYETTFSRDNSFCQHNGQSFQLQIRSVDKYSQPNDVDYGEYPFILQNNVSYKVSFNDDIGRYRFIYSSEQSCSKTLSISFTENELTLFYAKDNRPYADLLIAVHYNPKTLYARIVNTEIPIIKYIKFPKLLKFSSYTPSTQMSDFVFENKNHTLLQINFPIWKKFDGEKISTDAKHTFSSFEWKKYFADENEFKKEFKWNSKTQLFNKTFYQMIVSSTQMRRCLLIGHEWRCLSF